MNSYPISGDQHSSLENFAAVLTDTAYLVALRHGVSGSSVDLELKLWQALGEAVRKWEQELPPCR
jgi:hypothetical protein